MITYRQFVAKLMKLTFYLIIVLTVLSFRAFFKPYIFISWASLFFFLGMTLFSGYYNSRSIKKPFFMNIFLMTLGIKFFATIVFVGVYFLVLKPIMWTVIPIMLLFAIFKTFETIMLLQFSKDLDEVGLN